MHNILIAKAAQSVSIDFAALPPVSQTYFIEYGMRQALNDATASLKLADYKSEAEFKDAAMALVNKRLDGILKGELRQSVGRISDPVESLVMKYAIAIVSNAIVAKGAKLKDYTMKDLRERAQAYIEKAGDKLRARANAEIEANKADSIDIEV